MDQSEIESIISEITDPEIGRSLGELSMLKSVEREDDNRCNVQIELPTPAYPARDRIGQKIIEAIQSASGSDWDVTVNYSSCVQGKESGGTIGLRVKNVIAVGSGKGGVGKSTVAASLAHGLHSCGAKVGIMDADVYGPSIPHLMGVTGQPAVVEQTAADGSAINRIQPLEADGIKVISIGFFVPEEKAVIWRGPMLHKTLTQFMKDTDWGELDYLIVDMPPGTGDVALTLSQLVGLAGAVVVCTPQQVALLDAVKAINMFQQVNIPLLGMVENMSGEIFGRGGAKRKAEEMNVPFLGEIPIQAEIRKHGDAGKIVDLFKEDSPARESLMNVCEQTAIEIARTLLKTPSMPTLDIL